jgi:hypothetical protein
MLEEVRFLWQQLMAAESGDAAEERVAASDSNFLRWHPGVVGCSLLRLVAVEC